jgi:hypothetical protein
MKFNSIVAFVALGAHTTLAYPGMGAMIKDIGVKARQSNSPMSTELLGDLIDLDDQELTRSGRDLKSLLEGGGNPESDAKYLFTPPLGGLWCRMDTCCVWQHIANDLEDMFRGEAGRCTRLARQAVRIGFHDAGTWSKSTGHNGGGADGSIILANELSRIENSGMSDMADQYRALYTRYHDELGYTSVSMADMIQLGSTVATVVCPLGPRIRTWVGRQDRWTAAPLGQLPNPFQAAESLIEMFENKTISARGLVALLGSHTTSQQHFVNTTRAGDPQDSTPGVWDNLYFRETMAAEGNVSARLYRLESDTNLANYGSTRRDFEMYGAEADGQRIWNSDYARETIRLSLLGVNNINTMTECTRVLPKSTNTFRNRDQHIIDQWLNSVDLSAVWDKISRFIEDGKLAPAVELDLTPPSDSQ